MSDLKVISAKISPDFFDDLEDLRESLHIPTRQELIERSLRLFIHSAREASRQYTGIMEPDQIVCLPLNSKKTDIAEGQNRSENEEKSRYSGLTDDELITLYKVADRPPTWMKQRVEEIYGGQA